VRLTYLQVRVGPAAAQRQFPSCEEAGLATQNTEHVSVGRLVLEPGRRWSDDVTSLPQGHDARVVGDEVAVVVDRYGASNHAR
jgi:hypothetical protein